MSERQGFIIIPIREGDQLPEVRRKGGARELVCWKRGDRPDELRFLDIPPEAKKREVFKVPFQEVNQADPCISQYW
jgi:hypothetical protein